MVTLTDDGAYYATPQDSIIRVLNNAAVIVILPNPGSADQVIQIEDGSGASNIHVSSKNIDVHLTNFQRVAVMWDSQRSEWFI